jgi:hypothetical protein
MTASASKQFRVGDLVKFKRGSSPFRSPAGVDGLVLVTRLLSGRTFFYGCKCFDTGEEHLWSYDQFYLVSKVSR